MFMVIDLFKCHNFGLCLGLGPRGPLAVLPLNVKLPCPGLDTLLASTVTVGISFSSVFLAVEIHTRTLTWQSISKFKKLYLLICVATCMYYFCFSKQFFKRKIINKTYYLFIYFFFF